MKNLLLFICLAVTTSAAAQTPAAAVAKAKQYYPGMLKYEYKYKSDAYYEGLIPYYFYHVEMTKNAGFSCAPNATRTVRCMIGYWGSGKYKQHKMSSYSGVITGMPAVTKERIEAALPSGFDFASTYPTYDLEAMKSIGEFKILDRDDVYWYNQEEIWVPIQVEVERIKNSSIVKQTERFNLVFKTKDCGKTITFEKRHGYNGSSVPGSPKNEPVVISTTDYSREEIAAFKENSVARQLGNDLAKKRLENMPKLNIPTTNVEDMSDFAHELFLTGSKEEVEAFFILTTPSYRMMAEDGSGFEVDYIQKEFIAKSMAAIFDGGKNYRNEYCKTSVISSRTKNGLCYSNHNLTSNSCFSFFKENDKYVLKSFSVGYSGSGVGNSGQADARQSPCRGALQLEQYEMTEVSASIRFPKGMEQKQTKPARLKSWSYNTSYDACNYQVHVTQMDPKKRSNEDRLWIAEQTAKNYIEGLGSDVIASSGKNFTINGVEGYEMNLTFHRPNDIRHEVCRYILLGNNFYQISAKAPRLRQNEIETLATFTCTLKGQAGSAVIKPTAKTGGTPTPKSSETIQQTYKVGDKIIYRVSKDGYVPGVVKKDNGDGRYLVFCPTLNKHYLGKPANMKLDTNSNGDDSEKSENEPEKKTKKLNVPKVKLKL
ncbi:MAG: hypothetical protein AB8B72_11485 [Crocinitomicaceae bacterium]